MADIFISYSKSDRPAASMLAAYLEAQGWTVWWDKHIGVGDEFRDEIMRQLAAARAVVVIWSESSAKSKWVRAEAAAAARDRKLIPTKLANLPHDDIPLPFGEEHTEDVADLPVVRAAVVARLAAGPAPPPFWKTLRFELLSWAGVIAASVALAGHMQGLVKLSIISRYIVENWITLLHRLWRTVLFFVPNLARTDAIVLSVLTFTAITVYLSPVVEVGDAHRMGRERARVVISFSFLLLIFYLGIFLSLDPRSVLYQAANYATALVGINLGALDEGMQSMLMVLVIMLTLGGGLLLLAAINVVANWRRPPSHEINVAASSLRLHRIAIGVVLIFVLSELAGTIEGWMSAIDRS